VKKLMFNTISKDYRCNDRLINNCYHKKHVFKNHFIEEERNGTKIEKYININI